MLPALLSPVYPLFAALFLALFRLCYRVGGICHQGIDHTGKKTKTSARSPVQKCFSRRNRGNRGNLLDDSDRAGTRHQHRAVTLPGKVPSARPASPPMPQSAPAPGRPSVRPSATAACARHRPVRGRSSPQSLRHAGTPVTGTNWLCCPARHRVCGFQIRRQSRSGRA